MVYVPILLGNLVIWCKVIYKLRLSEPGECIFSFVCCTLCSAVGFFYVGKEFSLNSFFDITLVGVSGPILVRMILKYMSK